MQCPSPRTTGGGGAGRYADPCEGVWYSPMKGDTGCLPPEALDLPDFGGEVEFAPDFDHKALRTVIDTALPTTFRSVPLLCGSCARQVAR